MCWQLLITVSFLHWVSLAFSFLDEIKETYLPKHLTCSTELWKQKSLSISHPFSSLSPEDLMSYYFEKSPSSHPQTYRPKYTCTSIFLLPSCDKRGSTPFFPIKRAIRTHLSLLSLPWSKLLCLSPGLQPKPKHPISTLAYFTTIPHSGKCDDGF